jgi:hypothetical protein
MKLDNNKKDSAHISLSLLCEELDELVARLYGSSDQVFYGYYSDSIHEGAEFVKNRIGSTNTAFENATDTQKEDVVKLLKAIHTAKAQKKGGVGARKENKQPERHVDIAHDLLADYSFKTMRDTDSIFHIYRSQRV